ncbi:hypothetical protein SBRCBS47491_005547 [Sporothrix bragantina]|uniref:Uncharacterized protein n=1 Tax=Sporothrix bragantina TaxID=671064 RepID=A0ABP0BXV1_9PEZI
MHVQIPEVSPKDMPIPCCLPNCKVNHNAWLNAPIVEDSEIDSFGFTDVLFDKYDDIFRRLWLVDRELKVYGQFKAPIVPKSSYARPGW